MDLVSFSFSDKVLSECFELNYYKYSYLCIISFFILSILENYSLESSRTHSENGEARLIYYSDTAITITKNTVIIGLDVNCLVY